jgi:sugar O-acyltransferase (sialic acid O-acetyltransferase NeuD family)
MILYGASGHGKVVAEILRANRAEEIIFWDDNEYAFIQNERISLPSNNSGTELIVTVGLNHLRYDIVQSLNNASFGNAIHTNAVVSKSCNLGHGTVVMALAIINASTNIGSHVIVNSGAIIEHDCVVEDFVHVSPGATVCGGVHIGEGTWIGAGAKVKNGVKIGKWAIIGMGAIVISDVPDYSIFSGIPAVFKNTNVNTRK